MDVVVPRGGLPPEQHDLPDNNHLCMQRLFDKCNYDHTTLDKFVDELPQRDLRPGRIYNFAAKIFGKPRTRRRVIVAPPMEKLRIDQDKKPPARNDHGYFNEPAIQQPFEKKISAEEKAAAAEHEKVVGYRSWLERRKELRKQLESTGVSEEWLQKKPHKTQLEKKVLKKMIHERTYKPPITPPPTPPPPQGQIGHIPVVERPSPMALQRLEAYITSNRIRLMDLFAALDKDKNWKVSKEDLRKAVKQGKLDISEELLEDLILTLDTNEDDLLDYADLARGLESYRQERRDNRRKDRDSRASTATSRSSVYEPSWSGNTISDGETSRTTSVVGARSSASPAGRKSRASSNALLEPPPLDHRREQMVLKSEEEMVDLRKQSKEALRHYEVEWQRKSVRSTSPGAVRKSSVLENPVIATGDPSVDVHCAPSTMQGQAAPLIDKYRQARMAEYYSVLRLCDQYGVSLTKPLLERVLLHPGDKSHKQIKKKLRVPGGVLLSKHFAEPPRRPRTPAEEKKMRKGTLRKSKAGGLLIDHRHLFPKEESIRRKQQRVNLSTGRAFIAPKVDCYMTFEEYDAYTCALQLEPRYTQLGGSSSTQFWPGELLDKIRLCMPPYGAAQDLGDTAGGPNVFFQPTYDGRNAVNHGFHHKHTWPQNDAGYLQSGSYDAYRNKYIDTVRADRPNHGQSYIEKH